MSEFRDFRVIIPVRLDSKRLPNKALLDINGLPMIEHVYRKCVESYALSVVIATDSEKVADVASSFGAEVCMTSAHHPSGTDRLAEAVVELGYDEDEIVVNVQGDEPLMDPGLIQKVAECLSNHTTVKITTACQKIKSNEELFCPSVVKVVRNKRGSAIYFSRAPIPWEQNGFKEEPKVVVGPHYRHIGIYAYRVGFLGEYLAWDTCRLGQMESLEQLRVLWNGHRIYCVESDVEIPVGVDTQEDLDRVRKIFERLKKD